MSKLIEWAVRYFAGKFDGKNTYIGAAGQALTGIITILTGIVGGLGTLYPDTGLPQLDLDTAWLTISGGFYMAWTAWKSAGQRNATAKLEQKISELPQG